MAGDRIGVAVWAVLVATALAWGASTLDDGAVLGAPPLAGEWRWHGTASIVWAAAVGVAVVVWGPGLASRLRWPALVLAVGAVVGVWAAALAVSDGWDRLTAPLTSRYEYEPFAATIDDPLAFLRTYTDRIADYPAHVRGHPPTTTLVPWLLDRTGLAGAGWLAALCLVAWAAGAAAALVAVRSVAGEGAARAAAPYIAVAPAAVWAATSVDALFAGVSAAAVALLVLAIARTSSTAALAGGVLFAAALLLTYGALPLAAVPVAVSLARRAWLPLALGGAATVAVLLAVAAVGFDWLDGLAATREQYGQGAAANRPPAYFGLAGNPGAMALATGPAVFAGFFAGRGGRARLLLPVAALVGLAAADASLLSKGEVERIWLPFVPWLLLATARLRPGRGWLGLQVIVALLLQVWLVSPW